MKRHKIRVRSTPKVRTNEQGQPRERFEGLRNEEYRDWIRGLPCILQGRTNASGRVHVCWHPERCSDACHVESKARGAGDVGNLYPGCRVAHRDEHDFGRKSFEREWSVNLREIAGALWLTYESQRGLSI